MRAYLQDQYSEEYTLPTVPANTNKVQKAFTDGLNHGGSLQSHWLLGTSHSAILGFDYDNTAYKKKTETTKTDGAFSTAHKKGEQAAYALFLQDEWAIVQGLALTIGARQSWFKTKMQKDTDKHDALGDFTHDKLIFSGGLVYSGFDNLALRASYSQGFRVPNLNELYGSSIVDTNLNLEPEESDNFEIGARYQGTKLMVDLGIYYSTFDNAIDFIYTPSGKYPYQFVNLNGAKTWGTELASSYRFESIGITPYVNITVARFQSEDETGFKTFDSGRPEFYAKSGIKWEKDITESVLLFTDTSFTFTDSYKSLSQKYSSGKRMDATIGLETKGERFFDVHYGI